jgi:hypothetical protein
MMLKTKPTPRRKQRRKAIPVLGAAGLSLSLATGASAAVNPQTAGVSTGRTADGHYATIFEEEVADVSLATFYLFDKETVATSPARLRFAMACSGGGCGCGGCGCWTGTYYTSQVFGPGPYPPPAPPVHRHRHSGHRALHSSYSKD